MADKKITIYQLLPRLFGNKNTNMVFNGSREQNGTGKLNDITNLALLKIKELGISHVWYTGVIEHAITEAYPTANIPNGNPILIKGKAGSPYAITDYYDVNPDLAVDVEKRMDEFQDLIGRTHANGLKVLIDFIPNHLAREYHSDQNPKGSTDFGTNDDVNLPFSPQNNFYYLPEQELQLPEELQKKYPDKNYREYPAKATGNDQFTAAPTVNDWYETVKLNYGVDYTNNCSQHFNPIPDTWLKMKEILFFWAQKGIDGFRCDMAEMVPVAFWNWMISEIKKRYPKILFIAEVYNPSLYKSYIQTGKFDFLYDKVGLYDSLRSIIQGEAPAAILSDCWKKLNGLDEYMLRFLENHDEQRIASSFFAGNPQKALPAMMISVALHRGPAMIYFGQEVGEDANGASGFSGNDGRTSIFDYWRVPEHQKWMNSGKFDGALLSHSQKELRKSYQNILQLASQPAIVNGDFYDLMWCNTTTSSFNPNKIYAFLRHEKQQKLLLICNFSSQQQHIQVKIPSHAFGTMEIPRPTQIHVKDLQTPFQLHSNSEMLIEQGLKLTVPAYGYFVFELEIS